MIISCKGVRAACCYCPLLHRSTTGSADQWGASGSRSQPIRARDCFKPFQERRLKLNKEKATENHDRHPCSCLLPADLRTSLKGIFPGPGPSQKPVGSLHGGCFCGGCTRVRDQERIGHAPLWTEALRSGFCRINHPLVPGIHPGIHPGYTLSHSTVR